jgi:para-nitrobenzyl esterase
MKTLIVTCIAVAVVAASGADSGPTVAVTGGRVRGTALENGGAVFKGIPYAQPPVADLRWREPMPVKPWAGVRDATAFGATCAQNPAFGRPGSLEEDCLFVNVWTPEWPSHSRRPVMVWIHGGGNYAGTTSDPRMDGERLAHHGVVLVSLNYRLGSFGFFAHPVLTRESPHHASGNQGILDQIAALKWVRDNIARFGGDANNVTIFGESAGSLDVSVLMATPLSKGLFRRAIGQSGAVVILNGDPLSRTDAEQDGVILAARWGAPSGASASDLRAASVGDVLKARNWNGGDPPSLGIVIDGYAFPEMPAATFSAGKAHRVALLLGSNTRDRVFPLPEDLNKAIINAYGPLAARARDLYDTAPDPLYGTPSEQWNTDTTFRCSTVAQLAWHAAAGNSVFQYEFARVPPGREPVGATHSSDVAYVFGTLDKGIGGPGGPAAPNAVDTRLSEQMQQYWTNFAKTGNPNGAGLPTWPQFDGHQRTYMQLTDAGPIAKDGLRRPFCDLFIENVKRLMAQ